METFKIKAIVAAVKHKSLSRAAQDFSYTPSAFSHMTAAFEKELGVRIFVRHNNGVELTEAGKALYPKFCAMLQCENVLMDCASELTGRKSQPLRIATYSSISRNFLSGILKKFQKAHPDVRLSVTVADDLAGWLDEDRADIIFADTDVFGEHEWSPIMEDEFLAVAPLQQFGSRTSITRDELYKYPQIFTDDKPLRNYFDVARFQKLTYFHCEDDLSLVNMVCAGNGIAVLPALTLKGNADGAALLRLDPPLKRTLGFAYRKSRKKMRTLCAFIRFLPK